MPFWYISLKRS